MIAIKKLWLINLIFLIFGIILTIIITFLFKPGLFISDIETFIKNLLSGNNNISVEMESIEGDFFNGFNITNLNISANDFQYAVFNNIDLKPNLFPILFGNISFEEVHIDSGYISLENSQIKSNNFHPLDIAIENLILNNIELRNSNHSIILNGELDIISKNNTLIVEILDYSLITGINYLDRLNGQSGIIQINGKNIQLEKFQINSINGEGELNGKIENTEKLIFDLLLNLNYYNIPTNNQIQEIAFQDLSILVNGNIENWDYSINSEYSIDNDQFGKLIANGYYNTEKLKLNADLFENDQSKIHLYGELNTDTENWNLNTILFDYEFPQVSFGELLLSGNINFYGHSINSIHSTINASLIDNKMKINFDKINGKLYYNNNNLTSLGQIELVNDRMSILIEDLLFSKDSLYFNSIIAFNKLPLPDIINNSVLPDTVSGNSNFTFTQNHNNNNIFGSINLNSISNKNYFIGESSADFNINYINNSIISGNINGSFVNIRNDYNNFDELYYSLNTYQDSIIIDSISAFNSDGDSINIKEFVYHSNSNISLKDFQSSLKGAYIHFNNISLLKKDDFYYLEETPISFDNGIISISGKYSTNGEYDLWCDMNNIELVKINQLFNINHRLTGNSTGSLHISNLTSYPILLSNFVINNGNIDEIIFKECSGNISFRQNRFLITDLEITTEIGNVRADGWLTANGHFDDGHIFIPNDSLNVSVEFDKFELSSLNRYIPWSMESGGELSGKGRIKGKADDLEIDLDTEIRNPYFDKINGNYLAGRLVYINSNLYVSGLKLITDDGEYTATGSLPIIWSLVEKTDINISKLPLDIMITGNFSNFELITPYLSNIDSLTGDYSLQLSINGTYEKPLRSGQIVLINGQMNILQLSNPITNINGVGVLSNNKLIMKNVTAITGGTLQDESLLDKFQAYFTNLIGKNEEKNVKENISLDGVIDFTDFFNPDYSLLLNGENIFLKDSYDYFEGKGDLNLTITGKDTIIISGIYAPEPNQFTIISEFENSDDITYKKIQSYPVYKYDIQVPLENGIKVINSQMDLFLYGFINISAFGNEEFRFSGELNLVEGSFYYNGNEFTNLEGIILLDPTQFNPEINIYASTSIAGEDIDVSMTGNLENPSLVLESVNNYSQSDIIELLLFRENAQSSVTPGNSPQLENFVSNYFENELERNISRYTFLNKFQLNSSGSLLTGFENKNIDLYVGANISPKVYMNYKRGIFNTDNNFEYEVGYRMSKNMSLVAKIDEESLFHLNYRIRYHYK